ncbi:MAG: thymidine phosphorylase [Acidimicrobiia bacterium]
MTRLDIIELIERKRDGGTLTPDELRGVVAAYTGGSVPDYQMAALLMAVFLRGFDNDELIPWTEAMLHSGDLLDLDRVDAPKIDKHSTGGVGDKVSIPLAPLVAACGIAVPMMSGRGLGHTGGTLDKLESIPGFRTRLEPAEFTRLVAHHGLVLAGQSETLVPADRMLYALRDATGTVPSIPLIASSIMSKKLAEDLDGLVLDVKVGAGAFMPDEASARRLAETMVELGAGHGTPVLALLTDMDQPLGRAVGNANEMAESLDVLAGEGPADVVELTLRLGTEMLLLAGDAADQDDARRRLVEARDSGRAMEKLGDVIAAQGGDPRVIEDRSLLPHAPHHHEVTASRAGTVAACNAHDIGVAAVRLGAGRSRKEDDVDPSVGIDVLAKRGDRVTAGTPLARIAYRDPDRLDAALPLLERAWRLTDEVPDPVPLVLGRIG